MERVHCRLLLLAGLLLCATRSDAAASGPAPNGLEIAFRAGVQIPAGDATENAPMSDSFGVQFPLWLDLGYRFDKLFIGAYGQYAFGLLGGQTDCGSLGLSCSIAGIRTGFEAQFHPIGRTRVDPWIGVAFGYEWQSLKVSNATGSATVSVQGWEIARLGGGCDFAISDAFRLGPYAEFSIDEFVQSGFGGSQGSSSTPISRKALHFWISVGVKVTGLF